LSPLSKKCGKADVFAQIGYAKFSTCHHMPQIEYMEEYEPITIPTTNFQTQEQEHVGSNIKNSTYEASLLCLKHYRLNSSKRTKKTTPNKVHFIPELEENKQSYADIVKSSNSISHFVSILKSKDEF
jgi:hypothetical protein